MAEVESPRVGAEETNAGEASEFYIPASASLVGRQLRILKHGDSFAMFDPHGDILSADDIPDGLFHDDTRHLAHLEFRINGHRPMLLSSTVDNDNAALAIDLTNADFYRDGHLVLAKDTIHLHRSKSLWRGTCFERIVARNFDDRPHRVRLSLHFHADFADLFEVRGQKRERRGRSRVEKRDEREVVLRYDGLDGIERVTEIRFDPAPGRLDAGRAVYVVDLAPRERHAIVVFVRCRRRDGASVPASASFLAGLREARRAVTRTASRAAAVVSSNDVFNEVARRSIADLSMLVTETPHGPYPYAGIPWFSTAFGRDGVLTALMTLWADPEIARGTLRFLAAHQAVATDAEADSEPGKILHETRRGEMANLGEVPFGLYFGSVDSTPLFVMLAGAYFERTGDGDLILDLWPHLCAALGWIDRCGDRDGDGFVEYGRRSPKGLVNQGWKDSQDSVFHADGRLAQGPVALVEVQGYVYAAKRAAASLARALDGRPGAPVGLPEFAARLEDQAEELRRRFEAAFWVEELDTYALALDGDKEPCRVRSSNAGHALFAGIADPARARRVAATLMSGGSFSGWGIRTVETREARYNPLSYHNGSVWPHDNALIALGFARYGLKDEVARLFHGLFDAASYMELRRLPELFCGFARRRRKGPTAYPVACSPQAWAAAVPFALLQASLGLRFTPEAREICFVRPALPEFFDFVRLHGLTLGHDRAELELTRHRDDVAVHVVERTEGLRVVTVG